MSDTSAALKADEKDPLAEYVTNSDELDGINATIRRARRPYVLQQTTLAIGIAVGIALIYGAVIIELITNRSLLYAFPIAWAIMIAAVFLYKFMEPRGAQYESFKATLKALAKVDSALGTILVSKQRLALAAALSACSGSILSFSRRFSFNLQTNIIRQQAIRASQIPKYLVYLAMLGNDKDLETVRSKLVQMALGIGKSDWIGIGQLTIEMGRYELVKSRRLWRPGLLSPITLAILTAIPAVPVLITYLK